MGTQQVEGFAMKKPFPHDRSSRICDKVGVSVSLDERMWDSLTVGRPHVQ